MNKATLINTSFDFEQFGADSKSFKRLKKQLVDNKKRSKVLTFLRETSPVTQRVYLELVKEENKKSKLIDCLEWLIAWGAVIGTGLAGATAVYIFVLMLCAIGG